MEAKASRFDLEGFKKATSLQVIELYFNLQNVLSDIEVLHKNREQLQEQLERFELFRNAGVATEEDVQRLKAAVANADYRIAARHYEVDALRSKLELLSGGPLEGDPKPQRIEAPLPTHDPAHLDSLRAREYRARALGYAAKQAESSYYPTLRLNDTYTWYDYENYHPSFPVDLADKQNRLSLLLTMNLVDFGAAREQKEVIELQKKAQELELRYAEKSADADLRLAEKAIERAKTLLEAARKIQTKLQLKNLCACRLLSDLGYTYREAGKLDKVVPVLEEANIIAEKHDDSTLTKKVAELIDKQKIIGLFRGRMEFGPRALGNRSIIADARSSEMQSILNRKIKGRESFRPFAPACLLENAINYFELSVPSPYMLLVTEVKSNVKIPAVTHVDNSARIQTVDEKTNPFFYKLIKEFENRTSCGVIINTSFNYRDEPIVCTPEDAFNCFKQTGIDYLVLGNYLISNPTQ